MPPWHLELVAGVHLPGWVLSSNHLSGLLAFGSLCAGSMCLLGMSTRLSPQTVTMTSGPWRPLPGAHAAEGAAVLFSFHLSHGVPSMRRARQVPGHVRREGVVHCSGLHFPSLSHILDYK